MLSVDTELNFPISNSIQNIPISTLVFEFGKDEFWNWNIIKLKPIHEVCLSLFLILWVWFLFYYLKAFPCSFHGIQFLFCFKNKPLRNAWFTICIAMFWVVFFFLSNWISSTTTTITTTVCCTCIENHVCVSSSSFGKPS